MGNMNLVTGYRNIAHVSADDMGAFNQAIFGENNYVLNRGRKFSATVISNNSIRINDGDLLIQGRHARLNYLDPVTLTIESGEQGMSRNDLIVARYSKNRSTMIEECDLVVIKGTPTTGTPSDPTYSTGTIEQESVLDMPLYRVPINGLTIETLIPLFEVANFAQKISFGVNSPSGGSDGDIYIKYEI